MNCLRHPVTFTCAPNAGRMPITRKLTTSSALRAAASTAPGPHIDRRQALGGLVAMAPLIVSPPASQAAEGSVPETATGDTVAKNYGNFQTGNVPAILNTFSPNIVFSAVQFDGSPYKATYKGIQDVGGYFAKLGELQTVNKLSVIKVVASGRSAVAFLDYAGTVKATGKSYSTTVIHDWTADESGALVSLTEYWADTPAAAAAYKA